MKQMAVVLMVMLGVLAGWATGATTISASDEGNGVFCIYYTGDDPCVVGVTVYYQTEITSDPYIAGSADSWFDVFIDCAMMDPCTCSQPGEGSPVANVNHDAYPLILPVDSFSVGVQHVAGTNGGTGVIAKVDYPEGDQPFLELDPWYDNDSGLDIDDAVEGLDCVGDVDVDGDVDRSDISALHDLLDNYASAPFWRIPENDLDYVPAADVNQDAVINEVDIIELVHYLNRNAAAPFWRVTCP